MNYDKNSFMAGLRTALSLGRTGLEKPPATVYHCNTHYAGACYYGSTVTDRVYRDGLEIWLDLLYYDLSHRPLPNTLKWFVWHQPQATYPPSERVNIVLCSLFANDFPWKLGRGEAVVMNSNSPDQAPNRGWNASPNRKETSEIYYTYVTNGRFRPDNATPFTGTQAELLTFLGRYGRAICAQ